LAKCATTGIAATDIGAYTLHSWAGLKHNLPKDDGWLDRPTKSSVDKRRSNIQGKEFLIVDEVSMEDKTTAYCLSFGSMHIIQSGDFHQFPPVGNPTGALYVDRQFDKVVILCQQNRIKDETWTNILSRQP
jgi:hypothetical protein